MEREINKLFVYDGSYILEPLVGVLGLPIDQVNFIACQLVGLFLGYIFRTRLPSGQYTPVARHLFQVVAGLALTYFCFGCQIVHLFAQVSICYVLMHTLRPGVMEKAVFLAAMVYLAVCHIYRVIYDYGGYTLDITGPLMVNTMRLACLAYSLKDGSVKDESKLSPVMKYHASKKWPGILEFASYIFCFSTAMCGPFCFYKDYIAFIEGTNYDDLKKDDENNKRVEPPSPLPAVWRTLGWTAFSGLLMLMVIPKFPIQYMIDPEFRAAGFIYQNVYMVVATTLMRFKYYFGWKLGQAVNLNSGLGYARLDKDGKMKWNLLDNADIVEVETCFSLKVLLDNWNKTTTYWLRYVVYERFHSTLAVFFVSAFWHGFYSGYYITFMSGAIFVNASKLMRRKIRPMFQGSRVAARFYDAFTFLGTRVVIAYLVFPFVLLEFWPSIVTYWSMYAWMHVLVAVALVALPFIPSPRPKPVQKTQ